MSMYESITGLQFHPRFLKERDLSCQEKTRYAAPPCYQPQKLMRQQSPCKTSKRILHKTRHPPSSNITDRDSQHVREIEVGYQACRTVVGLERRYANQLLDIERPDALPDVLRQSAKVLEGFRWAVVDVLGWTPEEGYHVVVLGVDHSPQSNDGELLFKCLDLRLELRDAGQDCAQQIEGFERVRFGHQGCLQLVDERCQGWRTALSEGELALEL